jgi:hypothetical protein
MHKDMEISVGGAFSVDAGVTDRGQIVPAALVTRSRLGALHATVRSATMLLICALCGFWLLLSPVDVDAAGAGSWTIQLYRPYQYGYPATTFVGSQSYPSKVAAIAAMKQLDSANLGGGEAILQESGISGTTASTVSYRRARHETEIYAL